MKFNSKILGVLLVLLAVAMVISAASAVNLAGDFKNNDFGIDVISGTNFTEDVNVSTESMNLLVFENSGNNSSDVNSIIYFKDTTAGKNEINSFIKDLENGGNKVEETDKYVVFKNTQKSHDFDISNDLGSIFDFMGSIFSDEGLNVSSEGNSVSLSGNGLEVSSADGENISITYEGVTVSGSASSDNGTFNETVNVSGDAGSSIEDCDYSIYLKNKANNKVIVISGNNLELLKSMAETASFNGN
ncbi:hypothetical protein [Methanobrevibacter sp.]|uniref:hypothetical protein n=1 Tax=Methanobrevibacter sp. TaxID=66852 RepID=UPI0026DEEEC1|nr:hypothetical protein [Methanobrevibacter sp.]MDO5860713.1 hypothetical protein [Methanobrevibacter sp.]